MPSDALDATIQRMAIPPDSDGVDPIPDGEGQAVMAVPTGLTPWQAVEAKTFVSGRPVEVEA